MTPCSHSTSSLEYAISFPNCTVDLHCLIAHEAYDHMELVACALHIWREVMYEMNAVLMS